MSSNRMVGALLFKDGRVLLGHRTETRAAFAGVWDRRRRVPSDGHSLPRATARDHPSRIRSGLSGGDGRPVGCVL
jgi:hypothetical protein